MVKFPVHFRSSRGQAALMVILGIVVLLTIGLSLISRSITDIRISQETEESARAFSAAEAGIEDLLKQDLSGLSYTGDIFADSIEVGELTVNYTVTKSNAFSTKIIEGQTAEVNLEDYSGNLKISWSGQGLELTLIYPQAGAYKMERWLLKPSGSSCGKNFEEVSGSKEINVPAGAGKKVLRLRALCADANDVKVEGLSGSLPDQSYKIRSQATGPGGETRTVEVTKSLPVLPPVFDYAIFSGGDLSK